MTTNCANGFDESKPRPLLNGIDRPGVRTEDPARPPRPSLQPLSWHALGLRLLSLPNPILVLVGEPGVGKTEFLQHASLERTGHPPEELQGGPKTDDVALWGRYVLEGDRTVFKDGPLARALRTGALFVLNDAGQVPFAQLSALLPFRHAQRVVNPISQELLPIPATFRVVLTANRENVSCRGNLLAMQSLLDGALLLDVPPPSSEEVRAVLRLRVPDVDSTRVQRVLDLLDQFQQLAKNKDGDASRITIGLRAALQLLELLQAGIPEPQAVRLALVGKFLLDEDRYESARLAADVL